MSALSPQVVQRVLRRAAELEKRPATEAVAKTEDISEGELSAIAAEVGIAPEALDRALAEHRAGVLATPAPATLTDRLIGPAEVVCTRTVTGAYATIRAAVDEFLTNQLLQVKRNHGDVQVWTTSTDFWSRMRRSFDLTRRIRLPRAAEIEVAIVALGDSRVLVRLTLRLDEPRRRRTWEAMGGLIAGVVVGVAGIAAAPNVPVDLLAAGCGTAISGLTLVQARGGYQRMLTSGRDALERFLDALEHERLPAPR
jgi:hypothetical protein